MNIRETVYRQIKSVAEQEGKHLPPLTDDVNMMEAGLDSLCMAILIANLDDELKRLPFEADDVEIPVSIGDLIAVYEKASEHASA
jgi:hypothetical protein